MKKYYNLHIRDPGIKYISHNREKNPLSLSQRDDSVDQMYVDTPSKFSSFDGARNTFAEKSTKSSSLIRGPLEHIIYVFMFMLEALVLQFFGLSILEVAFGAIISVLVVFFCKKLI